MAGLTVEEKKCFPLTKISSVVEFFRLQLHKPEPNLAICSIILGFVENILTCCRLEAEDDTDCESCDEKDISERTIPCIEYEDVKVMFSSFTVIVY